MDKMPLLAIIFYSVPESYLIFIYGLVIIGEKVDFKRVTTAVLTSVVASYFVRLLPFPFGIHTLIGVIVVFIIFSLVLKVSYKYSLVVTIVSLGTLISLENISLYFIEYKLNIGNLTELWSDTVLRILTGWPHLIIWALIILFLYKKKIYFKL
ncbi:ribose/xylose/arabinose/galactoside ABC-type transport system permease subunit [Desulfohalotomaculum tongense]|uniref:hypothetical protein n=1 Tax=Desulforadius tongensis TaxID=1216062 RepID=UPI00195C7E51|nr:hypothetical protein [Desulforadius tongensis]MBM7854673.1 ribose/xylose/arabinose/galactoside ABC-type transport system permease subunit [Desulforadius tongensis]